MVFLFIISTNGSKVNLLLFREKDFKFHRETRRKVNYLLLNRDKPER